MAIPNVSVNITESSLINSGTYIPFIPAVLLHTKSGPTGTIERVNSEAEFVAMFGQSDTTLPAAFAFQKYLKLYQYAYVTRIVNGSAATASGKMTFSYEVEGETQTVDLLKIDTKYKTDLYNGAAVKLVYDSANSKIFIDLSEIFGRTVITTKEDIDVGVGSLKAAVYDENGVLVGGLEYILNKLVTSANAITNNPVTITNLFVNKVTTDQVPTPKNFTDGIIAYMENGNSGNSNSVATNANVKGLIDLYDYNSTLIDAMVIPEYRSAEIVNYAVARGRENYFRVIAQASDTSSDEADKNKPVVTIMKNSVKDYVQDERGFLEIYANDVTYSNYLDNNGNPIPCPVCIAVLNAYGAASLQNSWCAIAGVNRGLLTQVSGLKNKLTKAQMDELYDNTIPINTILYISGTGYVVWGNKTSANAEEVSLFDRVNVARLVNHLNRELLNSSYQYLFEPITLTLFTNFKQTLRGICQAIKDDEGIDDYVIICDSSNNTDETIAKNELHARVQVKPTEALEYIIIDLDATDTITLGVTTSDETEEVW